MDHDIGAIEGAWGACEGSKSKSSRKSGVLPILGLICVINLVKNEDL